MLVVAWGYLGGNPPSVEIPDAEDWHDDLIARQCLLAHLCTHLPLSLYQNWGGESINMALRCVLGSLLLISPARVQECIRVTKSQGVG